MGLHFTVADNFDDAWIDKENKHIYYEDGLDYFLDHYDYYFFDTDVLLEIPQFEDVVVENHILLRLKAMMQSILDSKFLKEYDEEELKYYCITKEEIYEIANGTIRNCDIALTTEKKFYSICD